ncbi:alpha/beta fold hydrolase [Rhizobacter sp. OV335]|uniref:S9 family peptidase n=1 Tax=Rhizobacter sp. OV335 TaxID=1500264 RepID=UPI00091E45A6|nr:alpha/beta fold hydrolase [Rhizobacter sp. OV335]SHN06293.1 Dipeptidyl aminopeptidase/acylaminoacyl peptidase [Rhizobacter sp. OV335]
MDPRTGKSTREDVGLDEEFIEASYDGTGALRFAITRKSSFWEDDTRLSYWYRPDAKAPWQLLESHPLTEDRWNALAFEDKDTLIISSRHGRDTWGVFRYDLKTRQTVDLMVGAENQDLLPDIDRNASVRGVVAQGLKPVQIWFDPVWAGLQATIDAARPNHINVLSGNPKGRILVYSYSDIDLGRWLVLDPAQRKLWQVAERDPAIDPAAMRPMETLRYPAADGMSIPAYLTRPAPSATAGTLPPLVVLIHGGPNVRDRWGFDWEVQILAAHGYAVFQPQFRGSSGFGKKFEVAGRRQWGLAMQDDITAGVQYLIDQHAVDPQRICIMGGSYGGYAALWGLVKTPALYKCGISVAGVSDIANMRTDGSDANGDWDARRWRREMVGSVKQDKAQFDSVSPLKHADRIQAPVLLIHGTDDERVPIIHGKYMRTALLDQGKSVEWKPLLGAGHGFYVEDSRRIYDTILPFLARYIGPPSAAPASAATSAPR